jgi:hypothetical protein
MIHHKGTKTPRNEDNKREDETEPLPDSSAIRLAFLCALRAFVVQTLNLFRTQLSVASGRRSTTSKTDDLPQRHEDTKKTKQGTDETESLTDSSTSIRRWLTNRSRGSTRHKLA